jgi:hypothetical protein
VESAGESGLLGDGFLVSLAANSDLKETTRLSSWFNRSRKLESADKVACLRNTVLLSKAPCEA